MATDEEFERYGCATSHKKMAPLTGFWLILSYVFVGKMNKVTFALAKRIRK